MIAVQHFIGRPLWHIEREIRKTPIGDLRNMLITLWQVRTGKIWAEA